MKSLIATRIAAALLVAVSLTVLAPQGSSQDHAVTVAATSDTIMKPADAAKILPDQVFYRGQTATTQARNAAGVRYTDGFFTLAVMIDNAGYSSDNQQKYQAYLLTEVPIVIAGHTLPVGTYGIGIVKTGEAHTLQVMDLGAHDLFSAPAVYEKKLHRPTPLQVAAGEAPGKYRLYFSHNFVEFARAK